MYVNLFSGVALMTKYCHKNKTHLEYMKLHVFHGNPSCNSEEWRCLGILMNNLAPMKTYPQLVVTSTIHVNCMKHDPTDLIYNFMLSKALLIHIYIVSIWCMTSFSIHIASDKCLYAYDFRHLFAGNLSLYRRDSDSAYSTASRATSSPIG